METVSFATPTKIRPSSLRDTLYTSQHFSSSLSATVKTILSVTDQFSSILHGNISNTITTTITTSTTSTTILNSKYNASISISVIFGIYTNLFNPNNLTDVIFYNIPISNDRTSNIYTTKVAVQAVILFLAVFGNACLMAMICSRPRRSFCRSHLYIAHLCGADLLVAFFNILPQLIWDIMGDWLAGDLICRSVKFLQVFVMYLSTYILVLTALDRRRAICSPLTSHTWTFRLVHISVGLVYLLSALLSLPQAIIFKYQETTPGSGQMNCWVNFHPAWTLQFYITAFTALVYFIPLIILIYAYGAIYYSLFKRHKISKAADKSRPMQCKSNGEANSIMKRFRRSHAMGKSRSLQTLKNKDSLDAPNDNNASDKSELSLSASRKNSVYIRPLEVDISATSREPKKRRQVHHKNITSTLVPRRSSLAGLTKAKMKTVKMTLVVILAYIGCWSPFFISQLWWLYDTSLPENNECVVIMLLLASLNSCVNPWIYMGCSGTISIRSCAHMVRRCFGRKQPIEDRSAYLMTSRISRSINSHVTRGSMPILETPWKCM